MPCTAMHLAIAEKYSKNNPKLAKETIIEGAVLPDLAQDKFVSHYGIKKKLTSI